MILVTGATGLNGAELVRRLSARGVAVRALVRNATGANAAKAAELSRLPGVDVAEGDMARPDTLASALSGIDRAMLISSSDPTMSEVQSAFIDAAARAGEIEQHLEASGMAFTHLRAGEFMHAYFRQVPSIVNRGTLSLPMADARIASIDIGDIAEVAADVLTSAGHEGKTYPITGPEALTMTEVAAALSEATGKPIRYVDVPPDAARAAQIAAGMPAYLADGLAELFAERRKGKEATVSQVIPTIFKRRPLSFADFARRHAAVFRGEQPAPRV